MSKGLGKVSGGAYQVKTDNCIGCGACEGECPTGAITMVDNHCVIDADNCVECGSCLGACPNEAIVEP